MANHQHPEDLPIPVSAHDPTTGEFVFGDPKGDELRESLNRVPTEDKSPLDRKEAVSLEAIRQYTQVEQMSANARMTIAHVRAAQLHGLTSAEFKEMFPPVAIRAKAMGRRLAALGFEDEVRYAVGDRESLPLGQSYIYDSSAKEDVEEKEGSLEDLEWLQADMGGQRAPAGLQTDPETGEMKPGDDLMGLEEPKEDENPFSKMSAHILVSFPNLEQRNYGKRPGFVHRWVDAVRDTLTREGGSLVGELNAKRLFASFRTPKAAERFVALLKLNHYVPENTIDVGASDAG